MRKTFIFALILVISGIHSLSSASAATASLPRYSSVTDATAGAFTASYKNLNETKYVTCALPAPIKCEEESSTAKNISGDLNGYRNEAGTLQVTAVQDGTGSVKLTSYELSKGKWKEKSSWTLVGGVTKVFVADDGKHFAAQTAAGTLVSFDTSKKASIGTASFVPTGSALTYSSTGKYFASYKPATLKGNGQRCYTITDALTGKSVQTCDTVAFWDLVTEDNRVFSFSPDDKNLVFRSDRDGYQKPYRVNLAAGLPVVISAESLINRPYQVADLVFVDNDRLAVVANRTSPTVWGLWDLSVSKGTISSVAENASYGVALKRFATYVSFGRTNATGVDATLWNTKTGSVTSIDTLANVRVAKGAPVPNPTTKVSYAAGGGYAVWEPSSIKSATPIVIYLHGGPYRQIATQGYHSFSSYGSFDWMLEQVRQSGAVIAKLDYPGSYGYGRTYAESLTGNVGVSDVAAVNSLITTLKAKYGQNAPVYLVGNSYGGYLADKVLVENPSKVAGIYSISGVSGWEELIAGYPDTIFSAQFKNAPFGQQDPLFQRAEVLLKTKNIGSQKVLLAHGDSDTSVGVGQTTTLNELLKIEGKNVSTTIYPGENHVFTKPANIADLCKKAIGLVGGNASGRCQL